MRCAYCDHVLPNDVATYGSGRCNFCGNVSNWGNALLYLRIRNIVRGCDWRHRVTRRHYHPKCIMSTALDFTDVGVINFKPQISSFYEVLVRCARRGLFHVKYYCDELFREDIIIEKMGVYVNIPESHKTTHDNTRVALIDRRGIHIYDGTISLIMAPIIGGKKEDEKSLYSEFMMIPYSHIKRILIQAHDTFTAISVLATSGSPVNGSLPNISVNRIIELFRETPAESLVKVV
ncbi:hypothetical protein HS7_14750 [Sulfolobales archaeon HS-7]|nr:hypothetical protein HS7_14750 [Sulfolobales archaeon HS-7]